MHCSAKAKGTYFVNKIHIIDVSTELSLTEAHHTEVLASWVFLECAQKTEALGL